MKRTFTILYSVLLCALLAGGAAFAQDAEAATIRVGSKSFPENVILGQMILVSLENAGFTVMDMTSLGDTNQNRAAMLNGQLDVYPEYTGTGYTNFFNEVEWFNYRASTASDASAAYAEVVMADAVLNDLIWLTPAPANNSFAIAMRRDFADANNLHTLSDFAAFVNNGGEVVFVADETFMQRPDGMREFESGYGFHLEGSQLIVIQGIDSAITEQALRDGINGINASLAYGTDGTLQAYNLIVLEDDLHALPVYHPAPVFRGAVIREHPEIAGLLRPIFASLSDERLQGLNEQVQVEGRDARDVAEQYLVENGFLSEN